MNANSKIETFSKLLFGSLEERQALQRIKHQDKYVDVLDQILGIQPHKVGENYNLLTNNLIDVLRSIHNKQRVNSESIKHINTKITTSITESRDGVSMVRVEEKSYTTTIQDFLGEVETIISRIPVNHEDQRTNDFSSILLPKLQNLNKESFHQHQVAIHKSGITMEKHPRFKECLDSFVNSLPENSEHHINDIIVHSYMCEFVTSFVVDNRVAIAVGVSLFVEIYPLMKQTGGLKYFLYSARDQVYYSKPFLTNLQNFTYEHKYPLAISAGTAIGLIAFPELNVIPSLFYSIPPTALELHLPSNEFARNLYLNVATGIKDGVFLALDLYGDVRREIFYKLIGQNIEEIVVFTKNLFNGMIK